MLLPGSLCAKILCWVAGFARQAINPGQPDGPKMGNVQRICPVGERTVPLSDDEQRRLDEIERALYRDDPAFAAGQSITPLRRRRLIAAAAVVLIGMVLLVVGLVMTSSSAMVGALISVTGFLTMVTGAAMTVRRHRG